MMSNETVKGSLKEKIDDLNQQAWEARINDSPKAFELSQESVKLARSNNYTKGLAEGLRSLAFCYLRLSENDEAAPLLRESLSLFQSLNDLRGQAVIYEYLGIIERNSGNLAHSLELLLKANDLVQQVGDAEIKMTCSYQIGVTYKHLGNHENALDYLYECLGLAEKTGMALMEAYATNIIGSIYFDNGNYEQALELYQQGLVIRRESSDKWGEAGSLDNIGFTYLKLHNLGKAIDYCKQSLAISQSTGDKKGEANALLHLAEIYEQADDIDQASEFSNASLDIRKARGDKRGEAEVLLFLAGLHKNRKRANDQEVFSWLSAALKIADDIKAQDLLSKACFSLYEYYQLRGDHKESLAQLAAHLQIEKELHKNAISQKVSNLEISHKAETISQRNKELTELNDQIEKANAELKIESSLERVRTAAMAMNKPDDMLQVCKIISQQLGSLDVKEIRNVQTAIFYEEKGTYMNYEYYAKHDKTIITDVDYNNHPVAKEFAQKMLKGPKEIFAHGFEGEEVRDWLKYQKTTNVFIDTYLETAASLNYYWFSLGPVALGISTYLPLKEEEISLFRRFRNVFELAYRRYLDIEKALAQAREAQIEAALEKVRSRSLAMHKSDELREVVAVLFAQLQLLGFDINFCTIALIDKINSTVEFWLSGFGQKILPESYHVPNINHPFYRNFHNVFHQGIPYHVFELGGEEKKSYDKLWFSLTDFKNLPEPVKRPMIEMEKVVMSCAFTKNGMIQIGGFEPLSEANALIVQRFAKVFQQSYTRFLDLQKAEAQAREAQIEAALERVRSRTMAMYKSSELIETAELLFDQLKQLGAELQGVAFAICDKNSTMVQKWTSIGVFSVPYTVEPGEQRMYEAWKNQVGIYEEIYEGERQKKYYELFMEIPAFKQGLQKFIESGHSIPTWQKNHAITFKHGYLLLITTKPFNETQIFVRFGKVFEQTYTRFLDLQKSEAQAREATIEAALEKVRAKVMTMKTSEDLNETSLVFGEQLRKLGIDWQFSYFWLIEDGKDDNVFWITWPDHKTSTTTYSWAEADETFRECLIAWQQQTKIHSTHVPPQDVPAWLDMFDRITADAGGMAIEIMKPENFTEGVYYYDAMIRYGSFGILTNRSTNDEEQNIQIRFATEFERAYTRFLDLQKAEAQTREALIEGALERVRARALAMQQPEELKDVAQVLRNEMGALGIEELETCSIYIHEKDSETAECWYALKDPKETEKRMVSDHFHLELNDTWVGRQMKEFYSSDEKQTSITMQGANRKEWIEYCYKHSPVFSGFYGETIPDRTYHLYKFSHGYIGAAAPGDISAESWKLLSRAASVFSLAYSRFKDLTQAKNDLIRLKEEKKRAEDALSELQATQNQLIQSEKMASLGVLTAGIAHEIQNPLNFVNNFSDVSSELMEEMKQELASGHTEQAMQIVSDVKDNLEKILHHGKRADAIVKGMLQHSRSSSGVKEPTDINNLADEYLRLAYHGYRAKDKSFNAKFETHFDNNVGQVNVIPQDIGRVILNLINNAFYTVNEKKKNASAALVANGYEPAVVVSTKKFDDRIEIAVKDNGNGIPEKMLDKIFQPFFTTKPTGQGTGLGLSLSYDIVTKGHAGEINVRTNEGYGAEFIVSLPVN